MRPPAATGFSLTLAEAAFAVWLAARPGCWRFSWPGTPPSGGTPADGAPRRGSTRASRWRACALLSAPVLVGLARPRILLPEGLTGEKRAYALAHEAAHAKRRDLWYKALLLWVCALHWFNPLVWALPPLGGAGRGDLL